MDTIRLSALFLALLAFASLANATAILHTEVGIISASYGSAYPDSPGSPIDVESVNSNITPGSLTGVTTNHGSTPMPNYGWVSWQLSETNMTFRAGQDYSASFEYPDQGYGFSMLDFLWCFTVEGSGGVLRQDLLKEYYLYQGAIQTTLLDVTDPLKFVSLSVGNGNTHDSNALDLVDGHRYLLQANLVNQSTSDGYEDEYFISLENAHIVIPEPGVFWLMLSGLGLLGFVVRSRIRV
jgi:hypothetical protein